MITSNTQLITLFYKYTFTLGNTTILIFVKEFCEKITMSSKLSEETFTDKDEVQSHG